MSTETGKVKLDRKQSPRFTIEFEDGKEHSVDPLEVMAKLRAMKLIGDDGYKTSNELALANGFKEALGLPSLSFSEAVQIIFEFENYMECLEKKLPWLRNSQPHTDTGSSSQSTSETPSEASASCSPDSMPTPRELEPVGA